MPRSSHGQEEENKNIFKEIPSENDEFGRVGELGGLLMFSGQHLPSKTPDEIE